MSDPTSEQIVMGFEAMRICIGEPTRKTPPIDVLKFLERKVMQLPSDPTITLTSPEQPQGQVGATVQPNAVKLAIEALKAVQGKLPELQWNGECGSGPQYSPCPVRAKVDEALTAISESSETGVIAFCDAQFELIAGEHPTARRLSYSESMELASKARKELAAMRNDGGAVK